MLLDNSQTKYKYFVFFLIPIIFGLWSLLLGQDRNFDLANYHLYNAFSFLNDKFDSDFAVASYQTYQNPILDLLYFFLIQHTPPQFTSFLMGWIHGLVFIILFIICSKIIKENSLNKSLFLAISGCLTANFLSGIGNTMGDNTTAILTTLSIAIIILRWDELNENRLSVYSYPLIFSGLLMGVATGLKLTNASFALALGLSILTVKSNRISKNLIYSLSALSGLLLVSGFWYFKIWGAFRNPIFPMYSNLFPNTFMDHNPFANEDSLLGPQNFIELILWPYISSIEYQRIGRGLIHQIYWPIIYTLAIFLLYKKLLKKKMTKPFKEKEIFISCFVFASYLIWLTIFTTQRYLVTAEVFLPMLIYIYISKIYPQEKTWVFSKRLIIISALVVLIGGFGSYGHSSFTSPPFQAKLPKIENPSKVIILMTDKTPLGWLVTLFPKNISFIRLDVYQNTNLAIKKIKQTRDGKVYAIFGLPYQWRITNVKKWDGILDLLGLKNNINKCRSLDEFIKKVNFRGQIKYTYKNSCSLVIKDSDVIDEELLYATAISEAEKTLYRYGYNLDISSCKPYEGSIGSEVWKYMWCETHITK
jgi:hypothetical protein